MVDRWKPSRREQHLLWYLQLLMRFGVGGGGLMWELVIDRLRDPLALLVFGTLATSTDVFQFARQLVRQAREDRMELEREVIRSDQARDGEERP